MFAAFAGVICSVRFFLSSSLADDEMGYRNDVKSTRFDLIDHSIWKPIDQTTAGVL